MMFVRLLMGSGRLAASTTNPTASAKASVAARGNFSTPASSNTIGVRISTPPSLANRADTAALNSTTSASSRRPLPPPQRATCSATQRKNPAASSSRLSTIRATSVKVAFHVACHRCGRSPTRTTPSSKASTAPSVAARAAPSRKGRQITRITVNTTSSAASTPRSIPPDCSG